MQTVTRLQVQDAEQWHTLIAHAYHEHGLAHRFTCGCLKTDAYGLPCGMLLLCHKGRCCTLLTQHRVRDRAHQQGEDAEAFPVELGCLLDVQLGEDVTAGIEQRGSGCLCNHLRKRTTISNW